MTARSGEETQVIKQRDIGNGYFSLIVGPLRDYKRARPGSFIHVKLCSDKIYFRRAMSVAAVDSDNKTLEMIYHRVGRGTSYMATLRKGDKLNVLGPLGVPFSMPRKNERVVCVAGGVGMPPLYYLASHLVAKGFDPSKIEFLYGGRSKDDIIEQARLKKLKVKLRIATDNGTIGQRGLVTDLLDEFHSINGSGKLKLYACGPEGMLAAVNRYALQNGISGELSLEAPMPCGIGVCLGCVVEL
ncbi:MAG: dihydroorotate dehydrogenase electron transfer subunit, partial [candidate division Zixibacteria bacterium]